MGVNMFLGQMKTPCWRGISDAVFPCTLPPAPQAEVPNGHLGASLHGHRSVGFPCILLLGSWLHHPLSVQIKSSGTRWGQQLWAFTFLTQLLFSVAPPRPPPACGTSLS